MQTNVLEKMSYDLKQKHFSNCIINVRENCIEFYKYVTYKKKFWIRSQNLNKMQNINKCRIKGKHKKIKMAKTNLNKIPQLHKPYYETIALQIFMLISNYRSKMVTY